MKKVLVFCAVVFFALGCTKSGLEIPSNSLLKVSCSFENYDSFDKSEDPEGPDKSKNPLDSRLTDTAFELEDKIGIYIHTLDEVVQGPPAVNYRSNMCYTFKGENTWEGSIPLGGDLTENRYSATGYYPYKNDDVNLNPHAVAHSVERDQSTHAAMSKSDFARAVSTLDNSIKDKPTLDFSGTADNGYAASFKHLMSKLRIEAAIPTMVDGVVVVGVESVVIGGLQTNCTVNLSLDTDAVTPNGEIANITPKVITAPTAGAVGVWEAIVVPQSVDVGTHLVTITLKMEGEGNLTKKLKYTIGAGEEFTLLESGARVTLTLGNSADLAFVDVLQLAIVDGLAKTGTFSVKAPQGVDWEVTSSQPWLTLTLALAPAPAAAAITVTGRGTGSEQDVYFALALNSSTKIRTANLTLSATINDRAESTTITVTQNYCVLNVASSMSIAADASVSPMLPFTSNQVWKATITATDGGAAPPWLSLSTNSTAGTDPLTAYTHIGSLTKDALYYHTTANGPVARSAKIIFSNSSAEKLAEQLVTQAPTGSVKIGKLYWATGNLVAKGTTGNECQVGASDADGLYFKFGSLFGWSATGTSPTIKPIGYSGVPTWADCPYYTGGEAGNIIPPASGDARAGTGDPCRFYLGGDWRLPTRADFVALFSASTSWSDSKFNWSGSAKAAVRRAPPNLSFPAAGTRVPNDIYNVGSFGNCWSSTISSSTGGYIVDFSEGNVYPQGSHSKTLGSSVRCVSGPPSPPPHVTIDGVKWTTGNLLASGTAIGSPTDYGGQWTFNDANSEEKKLCSKLGTGWRLPTSDEFGILFGSTSGWPELTGGGFSWTASSAYKSSSPSLRFPAAGYNGGSVAGSFGYYWSSSPGASSFGYSLTFYSTGVDTQYGSARSNRFPVRCVSDK